MLLTAVNDILSTRGLYPVDSLDTSHREVNEALRVIRKEQDAMLAQGWWFNTETVTLNPSADGRIYVPANTLAVRNLDPRYVVYLDNVSLRHADGYLFTRPVTIGRVYELGFNDMPILARRLISAGATRWAQLTYDGDSTKAQMLDRHYMEAYAAFNAEHIRNTRYNNLPQRRGLL